MATCDSSIYGRAMMVSSTSMVCSLVPSTNTRSPSVTFASTVMFDLIGPGAAVSLRPVPFAMTVRVVTGRAEDTLPKEMPRLSQSELVLGSAVHWISSTFPLFSRTSISPSTVVTDLVLMSVIFNDLLDARTAISARCRQPPVAGSCHSSAVHSRQSDS